MKLEEKTLKSITCYHGIIVNTRLDQAQLPDGSLALREVVEHPGGVAVLPLEADGTVWCVRQFRYPYKEVIYEIPAGKVEPGEDPFETGKREFKGECGAVAQEYFSLGEIYPSPGYTNEIIRLFGARGITFENQELDEDEFLEVHKMKLPVLIDRIMSGDIKDAKTVAAALKLQEYLKRK
jgi:ADP-ribose pyrophosphatase